MEFSNPAIDLSYLPKAEELNLQPIEHNYWKVLQLRWLITAAVMIIGGSLAIYFIKGLQKPLIIGLAAGGWLLITILSYLFMRLSFKRTAYAMREKDVLYRTGWIIRRMQVCPFNRIQHCSVHAGPLERRYGLASISLFTAGSDGSDIKIAGLTDAMAASIREFIMQKVRNDEQH
jgi:membrane protein YdbS with pleckstrin-like domain